MLGRKWTILAGVLAGVLAVAGGAASGQTLYSLTAGSSYSEGCVPPCYCPVWLADLSGSFQLVSGPSDPLYRNYRLVDVSLTAMGFNGSVLHEIRGTGTYRVGGDFALTHQLTLDVRIDGGDVQHLDSGLVPGGGDFPNISIGVSRGTSCFDIWMHIEAAPAVLYAMQSSSAYSEGCFGACACPIWLVGVPYGSFMLAPGGISPDAASAYAVENVDWTVISYAGDEVHHVVGRGTYRTGGSATDPPSETHRMQLDLSIDGQDYQHFDSGWVPRTGPGIIIDISTDPDACYGTAVHIEALVADRYALGRSSNYSEGCVPPCRCPVWLTGLSGSFYLLPTYSSNPWFAAFDVAHLYMKTRALPTPSPAGTGRMSNSAAMADEGISPMPSAAEPASSLAREIVGSGSYRVGGHLLQQQEMILDVLINGAPQHLESGLVAGGQDFPARIMVDVARGTECFDIWMHIDARRASLSSAAP